MDSVIQKKTNKHHLQCVVCGTSFGSTYDPVLKAFPIYHPPEGYRDKELCEFYFYKTLLRIYLFLLESEQSTPVTKVVNEFDWRNEILLSKDMITWCLARGFMTVDQFRRLEVPLAIKTEMNDLFESVDVNHPRGIKEASETLMNSLRNMITNLRPVPPGDMPFQPGELKLGESTLYDKIDTSRVELKSGKKSIDRNATDRLKRI